MKHLNQIILGNCLEKLKEIPDRSIDLVILDPPYFKVIQQKWDYQWSNENDYREWCLKWLRQVSRVIKVSGSLYLFGFLRNLFFLYDDIVKLDFKFRQQIVIDKGIRSIGGRSTAKYKMFPTATETILFFTHDSRPELKSFLKQRQFELGLKGSEINRKLESKSALWSFYTRHKNSYLPTKENWEKLQQILEFDRAYHDFAPVFNIEKGLTDVWRDIDFYKEERYHPTQKPLKLIERIIKASSNEGMTILDPFMGSGATAIACLNLNRYYIGIEQDKDYFNNSQYRISSHSSTQSQSKSIPSKTTLSDSLSFNISGTSHGVLYYQPSLFDLTNAS
jgi:DNA modification methylase